MSFEAICSLLIVGTKTKDHKLPSPPSKLCYVWLICAGSAGGHHIRQPPWHDEAVHGHPCTVAEQQSGHGE